MIPGGMAEAWMTIGLMDDQPTVGRPTRNPWIISAPDLLMSEEEEEVVKG